MADKAVLIAFKGFSSYKLPCTYPTAYGQGYQGDSPTSWYQGSVFIMFPVSLTKYLTRNKSKKKVFAYLLVAFVSKLIGQSE